MNLFIEMWPCPHKIRCHHYSVVCFVAQYCYLTAIRSHPKLVSIFNENRKIIKISKRKSTGSLLRRFSILLFDNIVIIKCVFLKKKYEMRSFCG